jgi:hypothetical protein
VSFFNLRPRSGWNNEASVKTGTEGTSVTRLFLKPKRFPGVSLDDRIRAWRAEGYTRQEVLHMIDLLRQATSARRKGEARSFMKALGFAVGVGTSFGLALIPLGLGIIPSLGYAYARAKDVIGQPISGFDFGLVTGGVIQLVKPVSKLVALARKVDKVLEQVAAAAAQASPYLGRAAVRAVTPSLRGAGFPPVHRTLLRLFGF